MRVLITGCGALSKSLTEVLRNNPNREQMFIVGVNNNRNALLKDGTDVAIVNKAITETGYADELLAICKQYDIEVVLPYITAELPIAARYKEMFVKNGIAVSVSSEESLLIANDKIKLAEMFPSYVPKQKVCKTPKEINLFACYMHYDEGKKLCCKIAGKCGGTGFAVLDEDKCYDISIFNKRGVNRYISIKQLCEIAKKSAENIILQEYIEGTDYSVCVLAENGKMLQTCGIAGYSMEYGAIISGEIIKHEGAYGIAKEIVEKLKLDGNCCFDFMIDKNDRAWLLECNPRLSASLPFVEKAGVHVVYNRCRRLLGQKIDLSETPQYGLKMSKYYESKYYN